MAGMAMQLTSAAAISHPKVRVQWATGASHELNRPTLYRAADGLLQQARDIIAAQIGSNSRGLKRLVRMRSFPAPPPFRVTILRVRALKCLRTVLIALCHPCLSFSAVYYHASRDNRLPGIRTRLFGELARGLATQDLAIVGPTACHQPDGVRSAVCRLPWANRHGAHI
jgi:hypothetical protein